MSGVSKSKLAWLGFFVVAALAILAVGVFLIGGKEQRFRSTFELRTKFRNVAGLIEGAPVRVGGLDQGIVKHLWLPHTPDQDVLVIMNLATRSRDVLKKDSVASIRSEGLLGDKYVEVSFGSPDAGSLGDGETIQSEPPLEVAELFKKAGAILESAQGATDDFSAMANNLSAITSKINQGKGSVGALINDRTIAREAAAGATAFHEDMDALQSNFLLRGFFNRRGYADSSDLLRHAIASLPPEPYVRAFQFDGKDLFDKKDTAKLKNEKKLKDVGKFLEQYPYGLAVVTAAAGPKGDSKEILELTQARSKVLWDYLVNNFKIDDGKLKTLGLGKTSGSPDAGKIAILVYPVGKPNGK